MSDLFNTTKVSPVNGRRFNKRWGTYNSNSETTRAWAFLATILAEDINMAYYVKEYGTTADAGCRADYIEYLTNRIEFELRQLGVLK